MTQTFPRNFLAVLVSAMPSCIPTFRRAQMLIFSLARVDRVAPLTPAGSLFPSHSSIRLTQSCAPPVVFILVAASSFTDSAIVALLASAKGYLINL